MATNGFNRLGDSAKGDKKNILRTENKWCTVAIQSITRVGVRSALSGVESKAIRSDT
jgi:hypothetical protein